jgi:Spy/CpxP family protein refolding chaperone
MKRLSIIALAAALAAASPAYAQHRGGGHGGWHRGGWHGGGWHGVGIVAAEGGSEVAGSLGLSEVPF